MAGMLRYIVFFLTIAVAYIADFVLSRRPAVCRYKANSFVLHT
jgi:hypothetical protein